MIPPIIMDFIELHNSSAQDIQNFLNNYSEKAQKGLIACMYIGREHIHFDAIQSPERVVNPSYTLDTSFICHISSDEYARILSEKFIVAKDYLNKLISCAKKSGFDLNEIFK